jgi:anti-anti-sigma factor
MAVRQRLQRRVFGGEALDIWGAWVKLEQWTARKHAMLDRLEGGLVQSGDEWKPIAEVADQALEAPQSRQSGQRDDRVEPDAPSFGHSPPAAAATRTQTAHTPRSESFDIREETHRLAGDLPDGSAVFALHGEIDQQSALRLQEFFESLHARGIRRAVLDFGGIHHVVSAGWGIIVAEAQRLKKDGGLLRICGLSDEVASAFELLEFGRIVERHDSLEQLLDNGRKTSFRNREQPGAPEAASAGTHAGSRAASRAIPDRIAAIIADHGPGTLLSIKRHLRETRYGATPVGFIGLYRALRAMNLHTQSRRLRYYRSC